MNAASWSSPSMRAAGGRGIYAAHGMIRGVCARIAERAEIPVWVPRAAFVIFGVMHWLVAVIVYFVMSQALCTRRRYAEPAIAPQPPAPGSVQDRFAALDRRLAELEAATMNQEAGLRRAFRDLERS
jgi:phage shock protein PspC (stress-responsive transcriptional regulator)